MSESTTVPNNDPINAELAVIARIADDMLGWFPGQPVGALFTAIAWAVNAIADAGGAPLEEALDLFCCEAGLDGAVESSDAPDPAEFMPGWPTDKEISDVANKIIDQAKGNPIGPVIVTLAKAMRLMVDTLLEKGYPDSLTGILEEFCRAARQVEWVDKCH
jgi:hypothetical protein